MGELVEVTTHGRSVVIRFRREAKLNAISSAVEAELCAALESPEVNRAACVVITGGERAFSAGADVSELDLDAEGVLAYYRATGDFAERVADLPQPTFSAISGWCLGGGLELALATDFRIADATAVFGFPEVSIGILPSSGGTHRVVRAVGTARARELFLLRERFSAEEALRFGLVSEVVQAGRSLERALEHAERLAGLPARAVEVTKRAIDLAAESSRAAGLELERLAYGVLAQVER
jgi:enoyl-CoA hydratase/carnithine racemase